jgi:hypothetical protein
MIGHESSAAPDALLDVNEEKPVTIENIQQDLHDAAEQAEASLNEADDATVEAVDNPDIPTP